MSDVVGPEPEGRKHHLFLGRTRERAVIDGLLHDAVHNTGVFGRESALTSASPLLA